MPRIVSASIAVLLAAGVWLIPGARTSTLAALAAHELMGARVGAQPTTEPDTRPELWEVVLGSPAVSQDASGADVLRLFGVQLRLLDGEIDPFRDPGVTRASVVRGLREQAAEAGRSLKVVGELLHGEVRPEDGASFLITVDGSTFRAEFTPPSGQRAVAAIENWHPSHKSALLPPLVALCLAVLVRRPVPAFCAGVFVAAYLARKQAGAGFLLGIGGGLADVFTQSLWPVVTDPFPQRILGFVVLTLVLSAVMAASGGMRGLVELLERCIPGARGTRVATWLLGCAVCFDDYASCTWVGTTLRPVSDRWRISREKLAYLVDSTAVPVAGLSLLSTWIAVEVSAFAAQLPAAGLSASDGYAVLLETLPYRFYSILTVFLAGWIAWSGRDLGPMAAAEQRAATTGQLVREGAQPLFGARGTSIEPAPDVIPRARNALVPLLTFFVVTLVEIVRVGRSATGFEPTLRGLGELLRAGECTRALLVGAAAALVVATLLALAAGVRSALPRAVWSAVTSMGSAIAVLVLAWMLGRACRELGTGDYLAGTLQHFLYPELLPLILLLLSGVIAFATGSAWGTLSILLPLVVGLAYDLGTNIALGSHGLMVLSIAAVLEGAVFGGHCSPVSDTNVLASIVSASDPMDHVLTQAPYCFLALLVALLVGYLPCVVYGANPWLMTATGAVLLVLVLRLYGKRVDPLTPTPPA